MIYLELLLGFLLVGCFAFGGAYGAIPLIRDVVLQYGWLTEERFTYLVAVSESTPGPIMVNLATYIGSDQGGILGAIVATISVVAPSFVILLLVMTVLDKVLENPYVKAVLRGIKACVLGIIVATGVVMIIKNLAVCVDALTMDYVALLITAMLLLISAGYKKLRKKNFSPIMLIVTSAILGMLMY